MKLEEITTTLCNWVEQDNAHRNVVCIVTEKVNETGENFDLSIFSAINCKALPMAEVLADMMHEDEKFAHLIKRACITYAMKHETPEAICVIERNDKDGKEDSNE